VQVNTLYIPEDGSDGRAAESWLPFRMNWDLKGEDREGTIRAYPLLRFADARSVSPRKLMVRVGVAMLGEAAVPDDLQIARPGEIPANIHLLETTYPVTLMKQAGEKSFSMEEDLTLPASDPQPEKILFGCLRPEVTEVRVSGNRLIFRGNANLHLLYRGEDGSLHTWDEPMPFSQLAELDQVYADSAKGNVTVAVTSLEISAEDGGHIRLACGLLGQYTVSQREMVTVVEDGYSLGGTLDIKREEMELPSILDEREISFTGEQTFHNQADCVVDATFLPDFPRQRRNGDNVELELPGQFQVLYTSDDGTLQSASVRWEGQTGLKADEAAAVLPEPRIGDRPQATVHGDAIQARAEGQLAIQTVTRQKIPVVTGLNLSEGAEPDANRPSLILRRAGRERLWDIAKAAGSTVEAIREANGGDAPRSEEQILLIPVL
jgi:hypothetical protein